MDEEDLIYLAGMVDADGSMYIVANKNPESKWNYYLGAKFSITGKDKEHYQERHRLMVELAEDIGASLQDHGLHDGSKTTRASGHSALKMLEALLPYLREKEEIARTIVEAPWAYSKNGQRGQSREEFEEIVKARSKVRQLNSGTRTKYDEETILNTMENYNG